MTSWGEITHILRSMWERGALRRQVARKLRGAEPDWEYLNRPAVFDWAGDLYVKDQRFIQFLESKYNEHTQEPEG